MDETHGGEVAFRGSRGSYHRESSQASPREISQDDRGRTSLSFSNEMKGNYSDEASLLHFSEGVISSFYDAPQMDQPTTIKLLKFEIWRHKWGDSQATPDCNILLTLVTLLSRQLLLLTHHCHFVKKKTRTFGLL